ncbi:MAG: transglutaminase family protein, partial [Verrucomicrobiota bacterium]
KERKLPSNVNPLDNKLSDPEERVRLSKVFENGLETPRGWVLPLQRQMQQGKASGSWMSGTWALRQDQLFLIPGDSPVGLRLPMESQPWVSKADYPYINNPDPTTIEASQPFPVLESKYQEYIQRALEHQVTRTRSKGDFGPNPQKLPPQNEEYLVDNDEQPVVRTALCVEPRAGKLFVFMPPLRDAEAYYDLIAAVEATAQALDLKVVIEGESPPFDPRIEVFKITPDPGVIEVNVHPSASWKELVERTFTIYDDARQCRLGTDKYMIDGRHTGTGGGNHIVMGGQTPTDSPFLRRPDLLRSMVGYWHQHPSLSYLFSGLFIGPTSQSPRVDEARNDSLYEMEIAFKEVDRVGPNPNYWMVDRIFRNLLIDVTGNTHRAEFCIDKLYSPDGSTGRLGLVELRSFEMPPHPRMSLAQQVLIRALIAGFWKQPYKAGKLTRWGTQLHDRWMLPHFVWQDFKEVLAELRDTGYAFSEDWFFAHLEFRFPFYGEFKYQEIRVELRNALEPWHVLGEHGTSGGTVRFVDSSVERMQIKAESFNADRYILTCNGRKIPMTATGTAGEYVAAVRYRAWQPPECLHPTIEVDTPLVIDLVDTWTLRSVAGCTYHVGHPGGRNYDAFPVNSYEAESRRLSRFQDIGHTPGPIETLPADEPNPEFPFTLDLRQF